MKVKNDIDHLDAFNCYAFVCKKTNNFYLYQKIAANGNKSLFRSVTKIKSGIVMVP